MKSRKTQKAYSINPFLRRLFLILGAMTLLLVVFRLLKFVFAADEPASHKANQDAPQPASGNGAATGERRQAPAAAPPRPQPRPARHAAAQQHRTARRAAPKPRPRRRWETVLLAVEVGAVLLFVGAGVTLWQTRRDLNDTYRNLQQTDPQALPTLIAAANPGAMAQQLQENRSQAERPALPTPFPTVTPFAAAVAEAGVDAGDKAAREAAVDEIAATAAGDDGATVEWGTTAVMAKVSQETNQPRRLQIPAIGVDSFIFQDYGEDWLKLGVVQVGELVSPGRPGNLVLAAHNDIYGEIFRDLDELQPGNEIHVLVDRTGYTYRVREILVVEPDDVWVTLPTATPTVTLVSCYPYLIGNQRIVVFADLVQ